MVLETFVKSGLPKVGTAGLVRVAELMSNKSIV